MCGDVWYDEAFGPVTQPKSIFECKDELQGGNGTDNFSVAVYDETNIKGWIDFWKRRNVSFHQSNFSVLASMSQKANPTEFCKIVFAHPELFNIGCEASYIPYQRVNQEFLLRLGFDFPELVERFFNQKAVEKPEKGSEYTSPYLLAFALGSKVGLVHRFLSYPSWVNEEARAQIEQMASRVGHRISSYALRYHKEIVKRNARLEGTPLKTRRGYKRSLMIGTYQISDQEKRDAYSKFIIQEIGEAIEDQKMRNTRGAVFNRIRRRIWNSFKEKATTIGAIFGGSNNCFLTDGKPQQGSTKLIEETSHIVSTDLAPNPPQPYTATQSSRLDKLERRAGFSNCKFQPILDSDPSSPGGNTEEITQIDLEGPSTANPRTKDPYHEH